MCRVLQGRDEEFGLHLCCGSYGDMVGPYIFRVCSSTCMTNLADLWYMRCVQANQYSLPYHYRDTYSRNAFSSLQA